MQISNQAFPPSRIEHILATSTVASMAQESVSSVGDVYTNGHVKPEVAANAVPASVSLPELCLQLRRQVNAFIEQESTDESTRLTQKQTKISLGVVEEAISRYRFEELSLSYNGGKDCLVLLILILACLPTLKSRPADPTLKSDSNKLSTATPRLRALYIAPNDPFMEVEDFVNTTTAQYHLDLKRYALPMRAALDAYLADEKDVKAIFMGTRRTDPHSENLLHFSPTDPGWPQFMRVNPMIDWHYADIWNFIRQVGIPYCILYDQGYTSLGGTSNTKPNPVLVNEDGKTFRPAYELVRDEEERLGRQK